MASAWVFAVANDSGFGAGGKRQMPKTTRKYMNYMKKEQKHGICIHETQM